MIQNNRIARAFQKAKSENRAAFIAYIMAGHPDLKTTGDLMKAYSMAGVDILEIGFPFTDPMADGEIIQAAAQHSLAQGTCLSDVLQMIGSFRKDNSETAIILMGYINPVIQYGIDNFIRDAVLFGVDGVIIVDAPIEEDSLLCTPLQAAGLDFIRLVSPVTPPDRMAKICENARGFIYYVSVTGVTGKQQADIDALGDNIQAVKNYANLPVAIGFGIRTVEQAKAMAQYGDAIVVGSALVELIAHHQDSVALVQQIRQNLKYKE